MAKTQSIPLNLYKASAKKAELVRIPAQKFLMIDGTGDPNISKAFQEGVQALYSLAYGIKFGRKKRGEDWNYKIPPLEGLWWSEDMNNFMEGGDRSQWQWRLMLAEPDFVTKKEVSEAAKEAGERKKLPALPSVRFEKFAEGPAVQMMYVGPYSKEGPAIERLHAFAREAGYELSGKHHEIYLGDPRRSAPDKLKTILRQPVQKKK